MIDIKTYNILYVIHNEPIFESYKVMKFKKSEYGRYVELMFLDYADSDVVPVENLRLMSVKIQRFCPPLAFRTELRLVSQGRNFMCK